MTQYSIAQARDRFTQLVHEAELGNAVEVTRRGQRVAVLVSAEEYDRLCQPKQSFGEAVLAWRKKYDVDNWDDDIDIDEVFNVRDRSPGRVFEW
ncbi:MAG: type II toxin-antitoxin system prevent-host-death family antitoxin [Cyanobacteria bacterium J06635_15]